MYFFRFECIFSVFISKMKEGERFTDKKKWVQKWVAEFNFLNIAKASGALTYWILIMYALTNKFSSTASYLLSSFLELAPKLGFLSLGWVVSFFLSSYLFDRHRLSNRVFYSEIKGYARTKQVKNLPPPSLASLARQKKKESAIVDPGFPENRW